MVKYSQTICPLLLLSCLSVFGHFLGLALNELKNLKDSFHIYT